MNKLLILMSLVTFSKGFLLDNSNTSLPVKQRYLTVAEYYGDSSRLHHEQEAYRDRQEQALKLLADQLQQCLLAMEQKINEKNESQQQSLNLSEQNFKELEKKYSAMKDTVGKWEQKYQELEQNYTKLVQNYTTLDQEFQQLKHLKSINQLQTLSKLTDKVNSFDSRISLLSGHEQSRNQDFLALYNLTTATSSRLKKMEVENNASLLTLQKREEQIRYNLTNRLDVLANVTSNKMDLMEVQYNASLLKLQQKEEQIRYNFTNKLDVLTNVTSNKMDLMIQSQNLSLSKIQQTIEQNNKKVVLVGCNQGPSAPTYNSGSTYKFPTIVTKIGLPNLTAFPITGKFSCPANGIYHISAVLTTEVNNVDIEIMKNSVSMHRQYIDGYTSGHWTPGAAVIALELKVNDTIWIKTNTYASLYYSCLTIFKV